MADNPKADMWSGFVAVFSVNVIIAVYVVLAFWEDSDEPQQQRAAGAGGQVEGRPGAAGSKVRTD